jgi:hypothetical protein
MNRSLACAIALATTPLLAQTVQPPFDTLYTITNIGAIPGLPSTWGGIVFDRDDPNVLLCSRWNTVGQQNLFAIRVVRDAQGHVTGFTGTVTPRASADRIDAGLCYHPSGVLFYSRYASSFTTANHEIGQFRPGSVAPDRVDPAIAPASIGGLQIVPDGLPGAGRLKTVRWSGGGWSDATLVPDANGTFDVLGETITATLPGGPDGFTYVPRMAPLFTNADVLVAEFNASVLAAYSVDAQGDPIVGTRQPFVTGLSSAFALTVDPVTQDILHAGWSGTEVRVIRGFGLPCGQCSNYGAGLAGTGGLTPKLTSLGCALAGETTGIHVGDGLPNGIGVIAVGFTQQAIPLLGGTLLNEASVLLTSLLDAAGRSTWTLQLPPGVGGALLHFQAGYLDPAAAQGFSMSDGVVMPIL